MSINVGILGSTGYTGCQLVSLLLNHEGVNIKWLTSEKFKDVPYSDSFPSLKKLIDIRCVSISKLDELEKVDLVFSCLPNNTSMHFVRKLFTKGTKIIDLSSDFRLKNLSKFRQFFKSDHPSTGLVEEAVYGIPELNRQRIKKSVLTANPGCFATTVLLSLAPLFNNQIMVNNIVVDIKAPISGAGRSPRPEYHFPETNQNISSDGFEINYQKLEAEDFIHRNYDFKEKIVFKTHRMPVKKGILTTVYLKLKEKFSYDEIYGCYDKFYSNEEFVRIRGKEEMLQLKNVLNSNFCDICFDFQDKYLIIETVLDNTLKGASGQAVQNMNIMFDFKENTGLRAVPSFP